MSFRLFTSELFDGLSLYTFVLGINTKSILENFGLHDFNLYDCRTEIKNFSQSWLILIKCVVVPTTHLITILSIYLKHPV
jgi:hypothetical protein